MKTVLLFLFNIVVKFLIISVLCGLGAFLITEAKNKLLKIIGFIVVVTGLWLIWYWLGCALYWYYER